MFLSLVHYIRIIVKGIIISIKVQQNNFTQEKHQSSLFSFFLIHLSSEHYFISYQYYKFATAIMNKHRQKFTYVTHPNNLPLELSGTSKRRSTQLKKQEYNGEKGSINQDSRSFLAKKIANNIHDLDNLKSVLPVECDRKRSRPNSIKTFKEDRESIQSSGVQYLMHKTENLKSSNHHEKAHISEYIPPQLKRPEKKHFDKENIEPITVTNSQPKNHKQTVDIRLTSDIYSNVYRLEKQSGPAKKIQQANLFKNGHELGLQNKRQRRVSENKLVEMIGSQMMNNGKGGLRQRRQDWRISNINFF